MQEPKIIEVADVEAVPVEEQNVVFKPNEGPQTEFLAASEREVLYGGSAGGGKSMRKVGAKGAPTAANFKRAAKTAKKK